MWGVLYVDINATREDWAYGPFTDRDGAETYREQIRNPRSYQMPVVVNLDNYPGIRVVTPA